MYACMCLYEWILRNVICFFGVCACAYVYVYVHVYVYMFVFAYAYIHACMFGYVHISKAVKVAELVGVVSEFDEVSAAPSFTNFLHFEGSICTVLIIIHK
mmetsp:Transcript_84832/g.124146  ORF Transcript_84832/g.124146 Transcript_84832/m.124146 type:complete len:100 (+) Transcript_84832:238-537(+)